MFSLWLIQILVAISRSLDDQLFSKVDSIDAIMKQMNNVDAFNCESLDKKFLTLPSDAVSELPSLYSDESFPTLRNRSNLLLARNSAFKNAFLLGYLLQHFDDFDEPSLSHIYSLISADISGLNGSAVVFDDDTYYAHWYRGFFNTTLHRFAPIAWRSEDFYEGFNYKGVSTNDTVSVFDGAVMGSKIKRYPWYDLWLPDNDDEAKSVYIVNRTDIGEFREYHGPPFFGQDRKTEKSVKWTAPYFDCGISNKWIVSATAPIVDLIPRNVEYRHMQKYRYVGLAIASVDFLMIDINQCDHSASDNLFAGTHKCKPTTRCEPISGYGFRRGGYQCMCAPGFRYPPYQDDGPFKGETIEMSSFEEYEQNFDCIPVNYITRIPLEPLDWVQEGNDRKWSKIKEALNSHDKLADLFEEYDFSGNFEPEEKLGLSIVNYLQLVDKSINDDDYASRKREKPLIDEFEHLAALCVSAVLADNRISGFGISLKDQNDISLSPFAFRTRGEFDQVSVLDVDSLDHREFNFKMFLKDMKKELLDSEPNEYHDVFLKWSMASIVSRNETPTPIQYVAEQPIRTKLLKSGNHRWSKKPKLVCMSGFCEWMVIFTMPINLPKLSQSGFGWLTIKFERVDIDQCESEKIVLSNTFPNNPFSGSHHCDSESSKCIHQPGHGLKLGAYKCQCLPGYEYPYFDQNDFFTGWQIESEFGSLNQRYHTLKCRVSGLSAFS